MARKKPAKKAKNKKKSASRTAAKKSTKKAAKKQAKKAKKAARKPAKKTAGKKKAAKPARRAVAKKKASPASAKASSSAKVTVDRSAGKPQKKAAAPKKKAASYGVPRSATGKTPNLDRPRKTVADIHGIPSSLDANRGPSAAKSGRADMQDRLLKNTSASPALTSGDVDADWESADAVGDEAPGGDNPTPDQDVVDDIGRALGVEYEDDEELQGGAEISDRDRHRWELDPASKDEDGEDER
jgi:hypothetical protein